MSQNQELNQNYQILARKYRPKNFGDLIGQEGMVQILSNSIKKNKIAQAFLLTGIRGVGKTSTARIIAKSLNCKDLQISENGEIRSCEECENCRLISKSNHPDVTEIDAASNTGIDDIRSIIDSIHYSPISSKYKIYIIDEVHMLSNSAFNALLKTLEEPPHFAKFILATTEFQKVPATIISRCQKFYLKKIENTILKNHLKNILKLEGYEIDENAALDIVNASSGSVRDALSLLDQAISMNDYQKNIPNSITSDMLGLGNKALINNIFENICNGNSSEAIKNFNEYFNFSSDINLLFEKILEISHDLLIYKSNPSVSLTNSDYLKNISDSVSQYSTIRIWQILVQYIHELKIVQNKKNSFESLIIRICFGSSLPDIEKIISNIKDEKPQIAKTHSLKSELIKNFGEELEVV